MPAVRGASPRFGECGLVVVAGDAVFGAGEQRAGHRWWQAFAGAALVFGDGFEPRVLQEGGGAFRSGTGVLMCNVGQAMAGLSGRTVRWRMQPTQTPAP